MVPIGSRTTSQPTKVTINYTYEDEHITLSVTFT